jgi:hypothetical protein
MRVQTGCVVLGLATALGAASPADAGSLRDCGNLLEDCNLSATQEPGRISLAQCRGLYDAAVKAGGQWGLPEARAATNTHGKTVRCFP